MGAGSWVYTQNQDHLWTLSFPAGDAEQPNENTSPSMGDPPTSPNDATSGPAAPANKDSSEEVRRATPAEGGNRTSDIDTTPTNELQLAATATPELIRRLFEATTPEQRAACIADPDRYTAQVESFFAATDGSSRPGFTGLQQFSAVPLTLPGGQPLVLFQVTTDANPDGALLRPIRQADGSHRIHWPLFFETHERHLEKYLQHQEGEPRWFHVGLRPSHGFDLPAEMREDFLIYELQGSADTSMRLIACAKKDTSLSRFLKDNVDWGEIYLARVLLRWTQLTPGLKGLTLLDCEGMSSAASAETLETTSSGGP